YRIVDLGKGNQLQRINDFGVIAGWGAGPHASVYRGGRWRTLADGNGDGSMARGVNDLGQVVGYEWKSGIPDWGVVWQPDKTKVKVTIPKSDWYGHPEAISSTGFIAGEYLDPASGTPRCFVQRPDGRSIDLGLIADARQCLVSNVNDLGRIVGELRVG